MRILVAVLATAQIAEAAPSLDFVTTDDGVTFGRHVVPPPPAEAMTSAAAPQSKTIYLNKNGGILKPGFNNSRTDTSSIVTTQVNLAGWDVSDAKWAETVACMREIWAPFDVVITDVDPGNVPHIEARFGGMPQTIGLPANVGGVSPFTLDCSVVENSIVFAFPAMLGNNARRTCEVMSQEIGHSYGLDHELEASDPMTYLSFNGQRSFKNVTAACGESTARPCGIAGHVCRANQNSYQILLDRLGESGVDRTAPVLDVESPTANQVVGPGFVIAASATDAAGGTMVTVYVDGESVASGEMMVETATDPGLAAGEHEVIVEATDEAGNTTASRRFVELRRGGSSDPDDPSDPDAGSDDPAGGFMPTVGCQASGTATFAPMLFVAWLVLRRRRRAA